MTKQKIKAILQKMQEGSREERVYLANNCFPAFFLYYYLDSFTYKFASFHWEAFFNFEKLLKQSDKKEFLWIAFRESAKSTIARAFITWLVVSKKRKYIILASYDGGNAESSLYSIINKLQTDKLLKSDYGQLCPTTKETQEEKGFNRIKKFLTRNDVLIEAMTTQQSIRGKLHSTSRPDFFLGDDLENYKTASSDLITQKTKEFLKEMRTALDTKDGRIVYLANYFSDIGVVQDLLDNKQRMIYQNNPLLAGEEIQWSAKYGLEEGKVSIESVKQMAGDSVTFETEYLNLPFSEDRRIFKNAFFREVDELPKDKRLSCYVLLDPAPTKTEQSDYTGISIVWVDNEGFWYVKAFRQKFEPKEFVNLLFTFQEMYKPERIGVEEIGFTQGLKPFVDEEMRRRNRYFSFKFLKHNQQHKETRIRGLLPYFESGSILFLKDECDDLKEELLRFPHSRYDDVMDALAFAPQVIVKPPDDFHKVLPPEPLLYPEIGI